MSGYNGSGEAQQSDFKDQIQHLLWAEPLRHFKIISLGGERRPVPGCCSLAIGPTTMSSLPPPKGGSAFFRKDQVVGINALRC